MNYDFFRAERAIIIISLAITIIASILFSAARVAAEPTIAVDNVNGTAGNQVEVPISFVQNESVFVDTIQFTLRLPGIVTFDNITWSDGDSTSISGKTSDVVGGTTYINVTILGSGISQFLTGELVIITLDISPGAANGTYALNLTDISMWDLDFNEINDSQHINGSITVLANATPLTQVGNFRATAISSTKINVTWNASADPQVEGYKLRRNNTLLTTLNSSNTTYFLDTSLLINTSYLYNITSYSLLDPNGPYATANATTFPDNQSPTINITSPHNGTQVNGSITLNITATDDSGVENISIYVDGNFSDYWHDQNQYRTTFAIPMDLSNSTSGYHTITAMVTDITGKSNSTSITLLISDIAPPSISIASPTDGEIVFGIINITADSTDNTEVANVSFWIDASLRSAVNSSPYLYSWNTNNVSDGMHNITAVSKDSSGNENNESISVIVNNTVVIADIAVSADIESATITWSTDKAATNSTIAYTLGNGSILVNTSYAIEHTATISGLSQETLYYYNITSCDNSGRCSSTSQQNFTTASLTPPPTGNTGGGGGGGGGAPKPTTLTKEGTTLTLQQGNSFLFVAGKIQDSIRIISISGNETRLSSGGLTITFLNGEERNININNDLMYDIFIKIINITKNSVKLKIALATTQIDNASMPTNRPENKSSANVPVGNQSARNMSSNISVVEKGKANGNESMIISNISSKDVAASSHRYKNTITAVVVGVIILIISAAIVAYAIRYRKNKIINI